MAIELTIIVTAIALWFAHGWYLNARLARVHAKLDRVLDAFEGLRTYLYEIDPQFEEERTLRAAVASGARSTEPALTGMALTEHLKKRTAQGRRNLETPFVLK